ncbi:hypothetical protein NDU88_003197 [Pleurodeles waltl]|uniref:Uncharacterized protein n=1 Tax=Pleurodeles waltl TaxID=8319 RepID=A0AAV7QET0_PLEWA|nr:hypothetical protein NDU88_003197 [Pleurodeles waltl]
MCSYLQLFGCCIVSPLAAHGRSPTLPFEKGPMGPSAASYTETPSLATGVHLRHTVAPTTVAPGTPQRSRAWGADGASPRRIRAPDTPPAGTTPAGQGYKAEAAAQLPTRAADNKLGPGRAQTSVRTEGSSRTTVYEARMSLSAWRRLNAGRVTHCAAQLLLDISGRPAAPSGSWHGASRSSGVPPPRSISTCLSGVCRHLGKDICFGPGSEL